MAVVVAPAIGPTLGGWITDNYNWRWIFYINVPIGIISLLLTQPFGGRPAVSRSKNAPRAVPRSIIRASALLVLGIGCLQVVLDKGQEKDWFSTTWITVLFVVAIYTLIAWVVWEYHHPSPIVEIRLFRNRNFSVAMFFTFVLGIVLFGTTVVIPQFLQLLLGYPAVKAGEALAGGGFMMLLMMPIAGQLVSRVDQRLMMAFGFVATRPVAVLHGDASEPADGFHDRRHAAHLSDDRAWLHLPALEHSGLCGHAARKEQPDLRHEQLRAQYRRQHRHCGHQHHAHAAGAEASGLYGGAHDAGAAVFQQLAAA